MIITLRSVMSPCVRPVSSTKSIQDVRSVAAAAVTSRPELLLQALALVIHECPDGVDVAAGLRKLAFDEYVKSADTDSLVRLLELECSASAVCLEDIKDDQKLSGGIGDALSLCVSVLGKPEDLSNEEVNPDVELVLIESVSTTLVFCNSVLSSRACRFSVYVTNAWIQALNSPGELLCNRSGHGCACLKGLIITLKPVVGLLHVVPT